jgi:hypothetical protein
MHYCRFDREQPASLDTTDSSSETEPSPKKRKKKSSETEAVKLQVSTSRTGRVGPQEQQGPSSHLGRLWT